MQIRKKRLETELVQIVEDFKIDREIMELKIEGLKSDLDNEKYMNNLGESPRKMVVKAEAELNIARLELEKAELTHANDLNSRKSELEELVTEIRIKPWHCGYRCLLYVVRHKFQYQYIDNDIPIRKFEKSISLLLLSRFWVEYIIGILLIFMQYPP